MRAAEIAQIGTPRELYGAPDNVFVATFMGEANHVRGVLVASSASTGIVSLDTLKIELPHRNLPDGEVDVVIRPEAIRLVAADQAGCLRATVRTSTYMGAHAEYNLDTPVGPLFCIAPEAANLRKVGEAAGVMLDGGGVFAVRA
jgi:iron(III) transport system ATP-binding protein